MDTAQDVTQFLRRELGYDRLVARADPSADRWCVYELRRRMTGGWDIPYTLSDDAEVLPGASTVRQVAEFPELIYVHEKNGAYAPVDRYEILAALRKQDRWATKGDLADEIMGQVRAARARKKRESSQMFADLAQEHRGLFKKAAEEMGL